MTKLNDCARLREAIEDLLEQEQKRVLEVLEQTSKEYKAKDAMHNHSYIHEYLQDSGFTRICRSALYYHLKIMDVPSLRKRFANYLHLYKEAQNAKAQKSTES